MGKASRRKAQTRTPKDPSELPAPYVARPFAGLPGETEWVAMREIIPAATARVGFTMEGREGEATLATILPMAWPALHRDSDEVVLAMQSGTGTGDLSRDLAAALLAAVGTEPGKPVESVPRTSAATPRLQDLLTGTEPLRADVREGFDFWVEGAELDAEGAASLERANEAAAPTVRLDGSGGPTGSDSVFWCRIGERTYVRWVLPQDEAAATDALARLHAADEGKLGDGRLLGTFRACGLLVPVWEVDADADPASLNEPFAALAQRYAAALERTAPLTADERRARNGFASRQITLR